MDNCTEFKSQDSTSKKSPFEDLSKEELISKCKGLLVIAQKAKQAKSEFQNEVEIYKTQLETYKAENKSKEESIKTLQELVDSLTEQKLTFITEIDESQSKLKVLSNKCNVFEQEINLQKTMNMSQKLSDLDSEIISLKRQNSRLSEENDQLITQLTELEARTEEFNCIGLQQREQLKVLEEKVQQDMGYEIKISQLSLKIKELEANLELTTTLKNKAESVNYELKIQEIMELYESEKSKNEKANIKLRSYKDKILKCANCINQLKNTRYILTKTVKEYSENIPKWQNEIIVASKILENKMNEISNENSLLRANIEFQEKELSKVTLSQINVNNSNDDKNELKEEIKVLNSQLLELKQECLQSNKSNISLTEDITNLKSKLVEKELFDQQMHENNMLKTKNIQLQTDLNDVSIECNNHKVTVKELKDEKSRLNDTLIELRGSVEAQEKTNLLIKALESEKAILVKEKQTAKDSIIELENRNKTLTDHVNNMKQEILDLKNGIDNLEKENKKIIENYNLKKDDMHKEIKNETKATKQQYDQLKKKYDNLQDLNGLLQEEVETLKLSLEQPKDDTENLSDINVSLQADIVKLETKLSAYKQENASLLFEVKESRTKRKEFDNLALECEDVKSKLVSYRTENAELLNEMKEINQVLKERGEAISKLQKAVAEMERLIETIEKDRDIIKEERNKLLIKVDDLESDIKNAEQNTIKNNETIEKIIAEKVASLKLLEEKEALIVALKEDIEKFKQHSSTTAELPNEDMSTSTISKAEEHMRMRELDETFEDKYTKLRIFALKLKKKLNETNAQLQSSEQERTKLKKFLAENSLDNKQKQSTESMFDDTDYIESDINKTNLCNLEAKIKKLTLDLEASEKKMDIVPGLEADLLKKNQELTAEIEAHKVTKEQLEKALKDVKKKNVLSLEMEDYERSMKELTTKMEENKKKIIQMESTIDTQESTRTAMKTQIKLLEEQIKTEETQNRFLKEELQQAIEDSKEKINLMNAKKDIISKLMQELENEKHKNEEANLEMTSALSDKEKIIMSFSEERADLNSRMKKVECKCANLNEKLRITNIELADLKTEYTSYKVRAQAVLRQNQTIDHSQEEQLKEEAAALKAQVETLAQKLATAQDQCSELSVELESSRKRQTEASSEAARAHQRTARLQADLTRISQQLDTERSQHKLQISTLTQCYKTQICELEEKLQKETEVLKKQIALLQDNMTASKTNEDSSRDRYLLPVLPREDSDTELDINVSLIPREEGEGSEAAPSPPLSKSLLLSGGRRSPVPLERLLEEGVPDNETLDTSSLTLTSEQEIADLRRKVQSQQQRVKHVTVLLAESERECARLSQLSELLKGELRRVRASTLNAHNTEYMKNVTLKFLTLPPGDERSRLVPVLQKILTLSSDETHKIQAIAKGQDPNPGKSWGSYLPWPGGK